MKASWYEDGYEWDHPDLTNRVVSITRDGATMANDADHGTCTIGINAARYAKGEAVLPVPVQIDNMARLKYIVKTTILHLRETEQVVKGGAPREVRLR